MGERKTAKNTFWSKIINKLKFWKKSEKSNNNDKLDNFSDLLSQFPKNSNGSVTLDVPSFFKLSQTLEFQDKTKPKKNKKHFWSKILKTLIFWKKPKKEQKSFAEQLTDLWEFNDLADKNKYYGVPSTIKEVLPETNNKELKKQKKVETKKQRTAKKITKLALRGKIPLEEILPMAFPDFKEWKTTPSKTKDIKQFTYTDVSEEEVNNFLDKVFEFDKEYNLSQNWTRFFERLCYSIVGALLYLDKNVPEEDVLALLSGNCGFMLKEAFDFVKFLHTMPISQRALEMAKFCKKTFESPGWQSLEDFGGKIIIERKRSNENA